MRFTRIAPGESVTVQVREYHKMRKWIDPIGAITVTAGEVQQYGSTSPTVVIGEI